MSRLKQEQIELEDQALILQNQEDDRAMDFDLREADDPDWWKTQDEEMGKQELEHIETQAEIQENRHMGYM